MLDPEGLCNPLRANTPDQSLDRHTEGLQNCCSCSPTFHCHHRCPTRTGCSTPTTSPTVWECLFTDATSGSNSLMVWDSAQDKLSNKTATFSNFTVPSGYTGYYNDVWLPTKQTTSPGSIIQIGAKPI